MSGWTDEELERIGAAEELQLASTRADGSVRPLVIMWVARVGDGLYVRSAYGADAGWYRRAVASGHGRIVADGIERDARFAVVPAEPAAEVQEPLDAEYHRKYDRFGPAIVGTVVGPHRYDVTLRLDPLDG
ncbi:DUF2255 family protein [Agromyces mediolanus]|uniref:DUF2255 family protein n=1 Tax=Agromyces mediolanus TaxID=41986 RepID=UPI0038370CC8